MISKYFKINSECSKYKKHSNVYLIYNYNTELNSIHERAISKKLK